MNEPPRNMKFGLLKCPFALREQIVRNMEFMDAFHFSTLSKRSKQMVHKAKYQPIRLTFVFEEDNTNDYIKVDMKDEESLKISLCDSNVSPEIYSNSIDGRKLASLIKETSDDYRKKLSAYLLFIFHSKSTEVHMERKIEHLDDLFLWSISKQFDSVLFMAVRQLQITPEYLQLLLNATKAKQYFLDFKMDDFSNFKYRLNNCKLLNVSGDCQLFDADDFLKRNPQMDFLCLEDLPGEKINNLLKQWIDGEGIELKTLRLFNRIVYYLENVIFDGIVTMATQLTEEQAGKTIAFWRNGGTTVDIRRKADGQLATVHINQLGCFASMCNEQILAEL